MLKSLSSSDRLDLFELLSAMPSVQFSSLVFATDPPSGIVPPKSAAQGDRVCALLEWSVSPVGKDSFTDFLQALERVAPGQFLPAQPSLESPTPPEPAPKELTTGECIDVKDIDARSGDSLASSQSHTNSMLSGSITTGSLSTGSNRPVHDDSRYLIEQFEHFIHQLNLGNPKTQEYNNFKLNSYWDIWRQLQLLRVAGDKLWQEVSGDNLLEFSEKLRETRSKLAESAIFFDEEDYAQLEEILTDFSEFRVGKVKLIKIRSRQDIFFYVPENIAERIIERNRQYRYVSLLDKNRISFRKTLDN